MNSSRQWVVSALSWFIERYSEEEEEEILPWKLCRRVRYGSEELAVVRMSR